MILTALMAFAAVARAEDSTNLPAPSIAKDATDARALFLKDCAHCHGATGHGDDGPDLHNLDWTDAQIAKRIRTGRSGQMTAFEGKLTTQQIATLVAYVRSLK
ncbi:MAG TPA: cytochrome c [Verrucomicrobiae bacterium]|nr:cytochrome c [Verrucomicrobiae bacterium]